MGAISDLKSALGAGLRTTKYQVQFLPPRGVSGFGSGVEITSADGTTETVLDGYDSTDATIDLLCKSASFPQKTIGQTEIWVAGKKGMLQGDTEFEHTWDVTFYDTDAHTLRMNFLNWQDAIDNSVITDHNESSSAGTAVITQLDGAGNATIAYTFFNVWPSVVGNVEMSVDSVNAIGEITITMSFDYWTPTNLPTIPADSTVTSL